MKIRNGFVSNSSSSSFLIIGTRDEVIIEQLANAMKVWIGDREEVPEGYELFEAGYGVHESEPFQILGGWEPQYVGFDIEDSLRQGKNINELKREFVKMAKEIGVKVSVNNLDIYYGEVGEG